MLTMVAGVCESLGILRGALLRRDKKTSRKSARAYDITITIIAVVVLLLALFVFIFMGMSSWTAESNFVLVILSLMITFIGGFAGWIRPQNNIGSDAEST